MKTTFGINFYCRNSKISKTDQTAPIEIGINISGRRVFLNLPRRENPKEFLHPSDDLSNYLSAMRLRINEIITEITLNGQPVTADAIRDYLKYGGRKSFTLRRLMDLSLAELQKTAKSKGSYSKYLQIANMFIGVAGEQREVSTLTPHDISGYEKLLSGYKLSTKAAMLSKLKTLLRYGRDEGLITQNLFRYTKIQKPTPNIVFLTERELESLRNMRTDNKSLLRCRDVALFQASCGLAYIDLKELSKEDVKVSQNRFYIAKNRHKTGTHFVAPIIDGGEEIFFRYNGKLPLLSNQKYNAYLKAVGDLAGIEKTLTSHVFRRTYATRLITQGVRAETAAKALGHSDCRITLRHYAAITDNTVIEEINSKVN